MGNTYTNKNKKMGEGDKKDAGSFVFLASQTWTGS